jgi:SAM-dependent methyltransferase
MALNDHPLERTIYDERMIPLELHRQMFGPAGARYQLCFYRHSAQYEFIRTLLRPGDRVLDLGCGTGYGSAVLAPACAGLVGIDYSPEAVAYAREHFGSDKCAFREGDALHTGLPDGSVDFVCTVQVIEHMANQEGFMKEVLRVLAPGGRFVAATPNKTTYSPEGKVGFAFHHKEYHASELNDFLSRYFTQVRMHGLFGRSLLCQAHYDRGLRRYCRGTWLNLMPAYFRRRLRKFVWQRHKRSRISTGDFRVTDRLPIDDSLDLIAVCWKENA